MRWDNAIKEYTEILKEEEKIDTVSVEGMVQRLYNLIDLTSLNETDSETTIAALCEKAQTSLGHVAAICTYPRFTRWLATQFANSPVRVATVANFPHGNASLEETLLQIGEALQDGAQEIDVVFPYEQYLEGDASYAHTFVSSCKAACGDKVTLKVILETGVLSEPLIIAEASSRALLAGADFIKTSTGKVTVGATLEAAAIMLLVIRDLQASHHKQYGFKAAGGIKSVAEAFAYLQLAERIMGRAWVVPSNFRIGSSKLVDEIIGIC